MKGTIDGRELRFEVLADLGSEVADSLWDLKLIHPHDAILWVATGRFVDQPVPPVQPWHCFREGHDDWRIDRDAGRIELAEELVKYAIESRRLRFVFVVDSEQQPHWRGDVKLSRLIGLAPEELVGNSIIFSADDGYTINIIATELAEDDSDEFYRHRVELEGFYLVWDEVAALRPDKATVKFDASSALDESDAISGGVATLPAHESTRPARRARRAYRTRDYGAPIATFLARALEQGIEDLLVKEKDETLGRWLVDIFVELGCSDPPHLDNAKRDAKSALNAWLSAMAQRGE